MWWVDKLLILSLSFYCVDYCFLRDRQGAVQHTNWSAGILHRGNTIRCKVCCTLHSQVKLGGFLLVYFRLWSTSSAISMLSGWSACKWDCKCNIFNELIMNDIKEQVTWIMVQSQFSRVHFSNCCKLWIDYFLILKLLVSYFEVLQWLL